MLLVRMLWHGNILSYEGMFEEVKSCDPVINFS